MIRDYLFFVRRFQQIEGDFLEITDFIDLSDNFDDCCYKIGSSKMMDFCLKIGTEVETLFGILLESKRFDRHPDITEKRRSQNITVYQEIIEPEYRLRDYKLFVKLIKHDITPFKDFDTQPPDWFPIYSKYKHKKTELIEKWNLKHSLFALGCLALLIINHPSLDGNPFQKQELSQRVFDTLTIKGTFAIIIL